MKNYRYLSITAALLVAAACNDDLPSGNGNPIRFSAGIETIETRSFLNSGDLNGANTELTIWAFENNNVLIPGKTASYNSTDGWMTADTYYWASGKSYTFFSYLSKDKDGNSFTGIDTSKVRSDRKLTVKAKAFDFNTAADNVFDFCYSGVVARPASSSDQSTVDLSMKHLYTALGFSAHNYTSSSITIKEISLVGLKNKKSALINFNDSAAVSHPADSTACTWTNSSRKINSDNITLAADAGIANVVGTASSTAQYFMFWPQDSTELKATGWTNNATAPTGGAYIKVVYNQGGSDITRYAQFPQDNDGTSNLGWPGGTKRMLQIAFRDNMFTLLLKAAPWDYITPVVDYNKEVDKNTIEALSFDEATCTVVEANHTVYFKGSNPITGIFKIANPTNATWVISKEGDFDAFELDNAATSAYNDGKDCNYGTIDGNDCSFTLFPKVSNTGRTYSIQLTFSIRYSNGESVCVDDKIQPVKWTFIYTDTD